MWEDFEPLAKMLSIRRSAVDGYVADVKTEASRDVIPLSGEFISFILRWQQIAPLSAEGWMFPSVVTGRPYHASILLRRRLTPLACKIGVPRLGWHTFRHTFRSWLGCGGNCGRCSAENDAPRRCGDNDEYLREGNDGQQA